VELERSGIYSLVEQERRGIIRVRVKENVFMKQEISLSVKKWYLVLQKSGTWYFGCSGAQAIFCTRP